MLTCNVSYFFGTPNRKPITKPRDIVREYLSCFKFLSVKKSLKIIILIYPVNDTMHLSRYQNFYTNWHIPFLNKFKSYQTNAVYNIG